MESRGQHDDELPIDRPAIARRSCDQCRARKIGCDRGSPCANCVSAKLACAHSAVSFKSTTPKQRVLISSQYERKIDDIARGIDSIKLLLNEHQLTPDLEGHAPDLNSHTKQAYRFKELTPLQSVSVSNDAPIWAHSAHMVDFVKLVVEEARDIVKPEFVDILPPLGELVKTLEHPATISTSSLSVIDAAKDTAVSSMPPVEAVVDILRWAKDHAEFNRMIWISMILPLEAFTEICRKVYFAVDDYSETDFIIANGCLSYMFSEHVVASGLRSYREYCQLCQKNLQNALSRLPLLLPASMEAIAALAFGTFSAIQNSKATMAWTFTATAAQLCQTLGYHRQRPLGEGGERLRKAQDNLLWTIHGLDKGLALRLGRSSNIRDTEITLPRGSHEPKHTRFARVQGRIYDDLYSPAGLSRLDDQRGHAAELLAAEVRQMIEETQSEISDSAKEPANDKIDYTRPFYMHCDLVCMSALLAFVLRAIPAIPGSSTDVSDECIAVARDALDLHQQCLVNVRSCQNDPFMVAKYLNWSILHVPFVPFSILFTRTVQLLDTAELARLDRFAASLHTEAADQESITHPYRLYELLCQTAHIHIYSKTQASVTDPTLTEDVLNTVRDEYVVNFGSETDTAMNRAFEASYPPNFGLSDWYYSNQQLMSLLDEDITF